MWMTRWRRAIERSLAVLDDEVVSLDGPVDLGVISVGAALGYLDFRHAAFNWQDRETELAGWWRDLAKRPPSPKPRRLLESLSARVRPGSSRAFRDCRVR